MYPFPAGPAHKTDLGKERIDHSRRILKKKNITGRDCFWKKYVYIMGGNSAKILEFEFLLAPRKD
jgi:hypothetical protein